ncbi:hypothetical protein LshimejAT787_0603800 [Lyophyllum shimeji]|uniref:Uncharacterized protein n=1 Tax=Lyophyllum shimeji TaxID=47721 RepID=A0A9P3UN20_LYOSH|nr:hypothetical protein LshimejAT787_0603800 [Lyophyllum shimeji]
MARTSELPFSIPFVSECQHLFCSSIQPSFPVKVQVIHVVQASSISSPFDVKRHQSLVFEAPAIRVVERRHAYTTPTLVHQRFVCSLARLDGRRFRTLSADDAVSVLLVADSSIYALIRTLSSIAQGSMAERHSFTLLPDSLRRYQRWIRSEHANGGDQPLAFADSS